MCILVMIITMIAIALSLRVIPNKYSLLTVPGLGDQARGTGAGVPVVKMSDYVVLLGEPLPAILQCTLPRKSIKMNDLT